MAEAGCGSDSGGGTPLRVLVSGPYEGPGRRLLARFRSVVFVVGGIGVRPGKAICRGWGCRDPECLGSFPVGEDSGRGGGMAERLG